MRQYQTETINELSAALAKAQGKFQHATKSAVNPHFKSSYADLPAVIDASRSALAENGLAVTQITDLDETGVTLVTQLSHASGQWLRSYYPVRPVKNDPQGLGSAITYARRYSYCAITGVAAVGEDDDGNAASGRPNDAAARPPAEAVVDTEKAVEVDHLLNTRQVDKAGFLAYFKIDDVRKLRVVDYPAAVAMLGKKAPKP